MLDWSRHISKNSKLLDSSGIRKVFDLASTIENPINLSIGQPDFDVPEEIKEEAIKWIKKGFNRYTQTQGIKELREKVIQYIKKTRGLDYSLDNVIITSGTSGGIVLALLSLLEPGDEVIVFDPYFVMYKHLTRLFGGKPVIVDTYPNFRIYDKKEKIEKAITSKTKAIFVNSPNNPTGVVWSEEDIKVIVEIARKYNLIVISDEIYEDFDYDGEFRSVAVYYPEGTLLLGGFSKSFGMTGWRLGFAIGPKEIISEMIKLQQYTFVCAPSFAQKAGIVALEMGMPKKFLEEYKKRRDIVYEGLKDNFEVVKPGGAFYIFPKLKKGNATEFTQLAIKNKVLVIPGNVFSERDTNFRISFSADIDTLKKGVEILNQIAEKYYSTVE